MGPAKDGIFGQLGMRGRFVLRLMAVVRPDYLAYQCIYSPSEHSRGTSRRLGRAGAWVTQVARFKFRSAKPQRLPNACCLFLLCLLLFTGEQVGTFDPCPPPDISYLGTLHKVFPDSNPSPLLRGILPLQMEISNCLKSDCAPFNTYAPRWPDCFTPRVANRELPSTVIHIGRWARMYVAAPLLSAARQEFQCYPTVPAKSRHSCFLD